VIGLNRAIRTTGVTVDGEPANSGIGFAISVNIIKRVVPVLIEKGNYDYPYLGISALPEISLLAQEQLGLKTSNGAYVTEVIPNGPADKAGLKGAGGVTGQSGLQSGGDLITAVDGRPIRIFGELLSYLMTSKSPGDQIMLTVVRGDKELEIPLVLGKRP
jgi:2-alkenal reductase